MRKINEFAELCKTSAKTLRFYDQAGVLSPEYVNPENGYRYYTDAQVERYNQIIELKQAGFTLEEIKNSLGCTDDTAVLERLRRKEAELAEACSHCRDMIRVYEQRQHRAPDENPCKIHRLTEKQRIILDDGKCWITLPCRREDMDRCCAVLEMLFQMPMYVNLSASDIRMHFDRDRPMLYLDITGDDIIELCRNLDRQFWDPATCRELRTVLMSIEFSAEGIHKEEMDVLTAEVWKKIPKDLGFVWAASLGEQRRVRMLGIF